MSRAARSKKVLASPPATTLPGPAKVWDYICRCFDIRDKDLPGVDPRTLQRYRNQGPISARRAAEVEAEIQRVLWGERLPLDGAQGSPVNRVARNIIQRLLETYLPIQQTLRLKPSDLQTGLLVVLERVVIPAIAEAVAETIMEEDDPIWQRPWVIGDEFRGDAFCYLPVREEGKLINPLPRTLEFWLRAGGLNTAYGLGRHLNASGRRTGRNCPTQRALRQRDTERTANEQQANKKQIERWLSGRRPESLLELHQYVDRVRRVDWLGGTGDWKARFTLAWAFQTAAEDLEEFFCTRVASPALHFAEIYRKTARYALKYQNYGRASFVARLVGARLAQSGAIGRWPMTRKMERALAADWDECAPMAEVVETIATRYFLLRHARREGVLSRSCISAFFPLDGEHPRKAAEFLYDLTLPFDAALPKETFQRFCDGVLPLGVKLIQREISERKKAGA